MPACITPRASLAAWAKDAFEAKDVNSALTGLFGSSDLSASDKIKIKAPDIAENGAVVPISVSTDMGNVESITIVAEKNAESPDGQLRPGRGSHSRRIDPYQDGQDLQRRSLLSRSGGKLYSAGKEVKVTIGGCGG